MTISDDLEERDDSEHNDETEDLGERTLRMVSIFSLTGEVVILGEVTEATAMDSVGDGVGDFGSLQSFK